LWSRGKCGSRRASRRSPLAEVVRGRPWPMRSAWIGGGPTYLGNCARCSLTKPLLQVLRLLAKKAHASMSAADQGAQVARVSRARRKLCENPQPLSPGATARDPNCSVGHGPAGFATPHDSQRVHGSPTQYPSEMSGADGWEWTAHGGTTTIPAPIELRGLDLVCGRSQLRQACVLCAGKRDGHARGSAGGARTSVWRFSRRRRAAVGAPAFHPGLSGKKALKIALPGDSAPAAVFQGNPPWIGPRGPPGSPRTNRAPAGAMRRASSYAVA